MIKLDDDEEETEEPEVNITEAAEKVRMESCLYLILHSNVFILMKLKIAGTKFTKELGYISHTLYCYC
jgi:hypothetical protein